MEPNRLYYCHLGNAFNNQRFEKGMNIMAKCKWCGNKTIEKGLNKRENNCSSRYKRWKELENNREKYC